MLCARCALLCWPLLLLQLLLLLLLLCCAVAEAVAVAAAVLPAQLYLPRPRPHPHPPPPRPPPLPHHHSHPHPRPAQSQHRAVPANRFVCPARIHPSARHAPGSRRHSCDRCNTQREREREHFRKTDRERASRHLLTLA